MKPLILFLLTWCLCTGLKSQVKHKEQWIEGGCGIQWIGFTPKDTVIKCYILKGKDSLGYSILPQKCNCDIYIDIEGKKHSCNGLLLLAIETRYLYWCKDVTFIKGKKVSESKPHWYSNISDASTVKGEYEQNHRKVYPTKLHMLKWRPIDVNAHPVKYTPEWVTVY